MHMEPVRSPPSEIQIFLVDSGSTVLAILAGGDQHLSTAGYWQVWYERQKTAVHRMYEQCIRALVFSQHPDGRRTPLNYRCPPQAAHC